MGARYRPRVMNFSTTTTAAAYGVDLTGLINAIGQGSEDGMTNPLNREQWSLLASYLRPQDVPAGQVLFAQGTTDRTLYLIESGSLSVHLEDENQHMRLAIVGAGSVVGEGAFFSHQPRSATVQASAASRLWALPALRFAELANRQPVVALQLVMSIAAVQARRLSNHRRRVAST